MNGKEYLEKEGFANIELFTSKGKYERTELISNTLEKYHKSEVEKLNIFSVSKQRELLIAMLEWGTKENMAQQDLNNEQIVDLYLSNL